eukprot:8656095-Ditylum_brightwellii.AAC.1
MSSPNSSGRNEDQATSASPFRALPDSEMEGGGFEDDLSIKRSYTAMGDVEESGPAGFLTRIFSFDPSDSDGAVTRDTES